MATQSLSVDRLLRHGAETIARSRTLRDEFRFRMRFAIATGATATRRVGSLDRSVAARDAHVRACRLVVTQILERGLCERCLAHHTSLDRGVLSEVLRELCRHFVVVRPDEACAVCSSRTLVHHLG
jgi:hypothetical protein